jgi:polyisoprenoid-binding protein YceI
MRSILLCTLLVASSLIADCEYEKESAKVNWKAFKTYEKLGVAGSFDQATFVIQKAVSLDQLLASANVTIETKSVNTGNAGRDATINATFFETQNTKLIVGKIKSAANGKAQVDITINGITKTIPMTYAISNENIINAKGIIDLADFSMLSSLQSINKACFDLHSGKTWQDVEIGFEIKTKKTCK